MNIGKRISLLAVVLFDLSLLMNSQAVFAAHNTFPATIVDFVATGFNHTPTTPGLGGFTDAESACRAYEPGLVGFYVYDHYELGGLGAGYGGGLCYLLSTNPPYQLEWRYAWGWARRVSCPPETPGGPQADIVGGAIGANDLIPRCPCPGDLPCGTVVKLSNDATPSASGNLAEVEPGKTTTTLRATVYDSNNQPVPNVNVKLEVTVEAYSGGHQHNDNRPKGLLSNGVSAGIVIEGNTGSSGMPFTFLARPPAGDHKIIATCVGRDCAQEGPDKVWVGVKDLAPLSELSDTYRLIGDKPAHPGNSYLSGQASQVISRIASEYKNLVQFDVPPTPVLHLNDASLERGGIFDINSTWARPHAEHCRGTVIDVRANDATGAIPEDLRNVFERVAREEGADPMWEIPKDGDGNELLSLRHYHVRLLGKEPVTGGLLCPW